MLFRICFGDDTISFFFVGTAGLILFLDGDSGRREFKSRVDGKMIGAGVGQASKMNKGHVFGVEEMVEGIAKWNVAGVESIEHAATTAGIEKATEAFKEARGV